MSVPLTRRYGAEHLEVFTAEERRRFLGEGADLETIAWQLLYRIEPNVYDRLVAGERIHPGIWTVFPDRIGTCVEIAAGTGRLTLDLASRCGRLVAVEPAAPMREILESRVRDAELPVELVEGFFDALPLPDSEADVVCSCSAFTTAPGHGGEDGLAEMERVCAPGGLIILVWPSDPDWLRDRGFSYRSFDGDMSVEFPSLDDALELAGIFYPHAVDEIKDRGSRHVPYEVLDMNPPRDVAWKRL